jgi:hypothetical protein
MKKTFNLCAFVMALTTATFAQNVGIGLTNPQYPLDINGRLRIRSGGDANSTAGLWLNNVVNTSTPAFIGMMNDNQVGIFGQGLRDWGFNMDLSNGNVGIGTGIFTAQYRLDVSGRMRIRSGGTDFTSAGVWLNSNANTTPIAFMGMYDDDNIGFYGTGYGWGLTVNAYTGSVGVGGINSRRRSEKLQVAGAAYVAGNVVTDANASVAGNAGVGGTLTVTGNVATGANLTVAGTVNMGLTYKFIYKTLSGFENAEVTCGCPAGTKPIGGGGGGRDFSTAGDISVAFSGPSDDQNSWRLFLYNNNPFESRLTICWAVCAKMGN